MKPVPNPTADLAAAVADPSVAVVAAAAPAVVVAVAGNRAVVLAAVAVAGNPAGSLLSGIHNEGRPVASLVVCFGGCTPGRTGPGAYTPPRVPLSRKARSPRVRRGGGRVWGGPTGRARG